MIRKFRLSACLLFTCLTPLLPAAEPVLLQERLKNLPFEMPDLSEPIFPDFTVRISDFGAKGDGMTLNTGAFAEAVSACVRAGGGTVVVPPGTWLTGPIRLESGVNLRLERGAVVQFSRNLSDFPFIAGLDGRSRRFIITPPLHACRARNVAITGEGIFDGAGEVWRYAKKIDMTDGQWKALAAFGGVVTADGEQWWPSREAMEGAATLEAIRRSGREPTLEECIRTKEFLRPNLLQFEECENVWIKGPTFRNSPKFHLVPSQCENVVIWNVKVFSPEYGQNTDGIDPRSCRNVAILDCIVDTGDDGICLKPAGVSDSQPPGPACANIVVDGCTVYKAHGGFVIGSESYGGVRNVMVRNCVFMDTDVGLRFKSARGRGGLVENVYFENIRMRGIRTDAILFDMYYSGGAPDAEAAKDLTVREAQPLTGLTPRYRDFFVKGVFCDGADRALVLNGLPEMPIRNMRLEDVTVLSRRGATIADAEGVLLKSCRIEPDSGPVLHVIQSRAINVTGGFYPADRGVFLRITGERSAGIRLKGVDFKGAEPVITADGGASSAAVSRE
ncbi:glycoside hydrolase family 28 protein [bacterium]|nr:glycoside hydrolase family 28 protein [bacterium]